MGDVKIRDSLSDYDVDSLDSDGGDFNDNHMKLENAHYDLPDDVFQLHGFSNVDPNHNIGELPTLGRLDLDQSHIEPYTTASCSNSVQGLPYLDSTLINQFHADTSPQEVHYFMGEDQQTPVQTTHQSFSDTPDSDCSQYHWSNNVQISPHSKLNTEDSFVNFEEAAKTSPESVNGSTAVQQQCADHVDSGYVGLPDCYQPVNDELMYYTSMQGQGDQVSYNSNPVSSQHSYRHRSGSQSDDSVELEQTRTGSHERNHNVQDPHCVQSKCQSYDYEACNSDLAHPQCTRIAIGIRRTESGLSGLSSQSESFLDAVDEFAGESELPQQSVSTNSVSAFTLPVCNHGCTSESVTTMCQSQELPTPEDEFYDAFEDPGSGSPSEEYTHGSHLQSQLSVSTTKVVFQNCTKCV